MAKHILQFLYISLVILFTYLPVKFWGQSSLYFPSIYQHHQQAIPEEILNDSLFLANIISDSSSNRPSSVNQQSLDSHAYYFRRFLLSGKVLFNDTSCAYLQQIGNRLLKNDPLLKDKIRFFALRTPYSNAYATKSNIILVSLGLLANVQSEAELAFILSHEISHYILRHSWDNKAVSSAHEASQDHFLMESQVDQIAKHNFYSQQIELEADSLALIRYLNAGYSVMDAESAIINIQMADHPYSDLPFNWNIFRTGEWRIPASYQLAQDYPSDISSTAKDKNSSSDQSPKAGSHPTLDRRITQLRKVFSQITPTATSPFNPNQSSFHYIQNISRYKCCYYYLLHHQYASAIYFSHLLLDQHPEDVYLKKTIVQALYGLARFAQSGKKWIVHPYKEETSEEISPLYHFLEQINPTELTFLAISQAWNFYKKYPEDSEIELIIRDLFDHLQELPDGFPNPEHSFIANLTQQASLLEAPYSILADCWKDESFQTQFYAHFSEWYDNRHHSPTFSNSSPLPKKSSGPLNNVAISKCVFVDPFFQEVDYRKTDHEQYIASRNGEEDFGYMIEKHAKSLKLSYELLHTGQLTSGDIDILEDFILLQDWITEMALEEKIQRISINHAQIQELVKKHGTPYFVWNGALSFAQTRANKGLVLSAGIILPPIFPYTLHYLLTPKHKIIFYTFLCNLEEGKFLDSHSQVIQMKNRKDVMNSLLYDMVYRLKH